MTVVALCENIPGPELQRVQPEEFTQQNRDGLITRCLMVMDASVNWDAFANPPRFIPGIREVMSGSTAPRPSHDSAAGAAGVRGSGRRKKH
jgi:hypothetical protein